MNSLLAIVSTGLSAPTIIGCRLRKGPTNSARGAVKFVVDVLKAMKRLRSSEATGMILLRADSAYYVRDVIAAAIRAGPMVSITDAEVAEIPFNAFGSKKKNERITDRLVVRRIPELNKTMIAGHETFLSQIL